MSITEETGMLFEHIGTGLRVVVIEYHNKTRFEMSDGSFGYVNGRKELKTASGQPCVPSEIQSDRLMSVDVWTSEGVVNLVRVD